MRKGRENVNLCLFGGRDAAEQFPKRWVERSEASGGICHLPRHEFLLRTLENVQLLQLCQQVPIAQGSLCVICSSRTCFVLETLAFCLFLSLFGSALLFAIRIVIMTPNFRAVKVFGSVCILNKQMYLLFQIVTAIFYVNMDIIMISQFVYYKLKNQKMTQRSKSLKNFCVTWVVVCIALWVILPLQMLLRNREQRKVIKRSDNTLDMIEMSGFICGYISCVFYLGSRFPQLYKNFRRRSTEGTSYLLFALAMVGNGTYGLSLVLKMPTTESSRALYLFHHLPWLIGSFGVLFLDIFVSLQFALYGQRKGRGAGSVVLEVEPLLGAEVAESPRKPHLGSL